MSDRETHEPQINIHHNKMGDVFIHLSPALNGWGLFTIVLASLFIGVFWWSHPHDFIALVTASVNTVAGFLNLLMWLAVATIGGFILNKLFLPFVTGVIHLVRPAPTVHAVTENFAVYSGNLQVHDHNQDKSVHNYKYNVAEVQSSPEVLQLPSPVPTGRQLLLDGSVERALSDGKIILGPGEDGVIKQMKIKRCFSTLVSGLPYVGKTTTVFWIAGQLTLIGAKLWIVDPHMYFEDEEGNKSLASELSDLADSFVFPPCEGRPQDVIQRLRWMYQQLRKRQQPGYIVRADETIIGIMDEYNSVADSIDKKIMVVEHEHRPLNFAQSLALVEREGRKYGLHFMLIGHKWAQQDIGGDNAVRTNATTYLCHRLNDETQGNLLLGSGQGKKVLALTVGSYWITGPSWNAEPTKITTPNISAADLPLLRQIKARHIQVVNQANVVEAATTSDMASTMASTWRPSDEPGRHNGRDTSPLGRPLDATNEDTQLAPELQPKMLMVLEMDEQSKNQNDIISEVWGVIPDTREGRAAKEELKIIRAYLAAMHRKTMRLGA